MPPGWSAPTRVGFTEGQVRATPPPPGGTGPPRTTRPPVLPLRSTPAGPEGPTRPLPAARSLPRTLDGRCDWPQGRRQSVGYASACPDVRDDLGVSRRRGARCGTALGPKTATTPEALARTPFVSPGGSPCGVLARPARRWRTISRGGCGWGVRLGSRVLAASRLDAPSLKVGRSDPPCTAHARHAVRTPPSTQPVARPETARARPPV
mmetsp:Transcript_2184/g.7175  ORF Transcript_2184/g.7175 Transcript_2184/m.7175 type:complete len:208 (-) Transcript_2184:32-655(-)